MKKANIEEGGKLKETERELVVTQSDFQSSFDGVKSILKKFRRIKYFPNKVEKVVIKLDFDKNNSSHLNLALIWRLILNLNSKKRFKIIIRYKGSDKEFLNERHFFDRFTGRKNLEWTPSIPLHFETFNPVRKDENSRVTQIFDDVTKQFLDTTNPFHNEIKIHMLEVITNAFDHSELENEAVSICSLDSKKNILDFCVIDMGQGVKQSFLNNEKLKANYEKLHDEQVIKKATEFNVSCNPSDARNPKYPYSNGGIGLFFLKEFVRMHINCHLVIISKKGYYYIDSKNKEEKKSLDFNEWDGTIVNFKLYVKQDKSPEYENLSKRYIDKYDDSSVNIV